MANYNQAALVVAAAAGASLPKIAEAAGVSVKTVQRELDKPAVMAMITHARGELVAAELRAQTGLTTAAYVRLRGLIDDEDPARALKAVTCALNVSMKLDAEREREIRVTEVLDRVSGRLERLTATAITMPDTSTAASAGPVQAGHSPKSANFSQASNSESAGAVSPPGTSDVGEGAETEASDSADDGSVDDDAI